MLIRAKRGENFLFIRAKRGENFLRYLFRAKRREIFFAYPREARRKKFTYSREARRIFFPTLFFSRVAQRNIFEVPLKESFARSADFVFLLIHAKRGEIFLLIRAKRGENFCFALSHGPPGPPLGPPSTISPRGNQTNLGPLAPSHGPPLGPPWAPLSDLPKRKSN